MNSQAETSKRVGHCPKCGPDRFCDVQGEYRTHDSDENVWLTTYFRILVCRGCGTAYFQTEELFSEDIEHRENEHGEWEQYIVPKVTFYPSPIKREKPGWWTEILFFGEKFGEFERLFSDVYGCLNAGLAVPAAVATRTVFDRASELLGVDPSFSFNRKLSALVDLGKISPDEHDTLEILVDAGSGAAHRGWQSKPDQLETMVTLLESFLHRTFVLGEAARKLREAVPSRPRQRPA